MKHLLQIALCLLLAHSAYGSAPDETLQRVIPGTFRRLGATKTEVLTLKPNGEYVFEIKSAKDTDRDSGIWKVRDATVILEVRDRGKIFKDKPAELYVIRARGDLALREIEVDGELTISMVFLRDGKPEANQSLQPTAPSRRG